ncbi:MAG TPA: TonB-dependent receptor, partial [Vicinamibacteria bacterium]
MATRILSMGFGTLALLVPAGVSAQTYQGSVRGAVRDANGGVLPGAAVTLIDEATSFVRSGPANEIGEYAFPSVPPGTYTLRVELDDFTLFEQRGLEVGVQRFLFLDVTLEIGGVQESITVVSDSPILETATASQSSSLESVELKTLPTSSRNPFFLSVTTPNVIPTGNPQFVRMVDQSSSSALSIAGGPQRGNNYTLDGVSITDLNNRAVIIPSIEAVEEVKIQASTYDAEMGRTGGGVFNTLHRSGSNQWGGSALIQSRPDWAVGKLYFAEQANEPKPEGYYWLYGGSFGGPIVRDDTFLWAATEGFRESSTWNTLLTLPTAAEARGDFSQSGIVLYDPLSTAPDPEHPGQFLRRPFPGNVIPPERLDPVGARLAAMLAERGSGSLSASSNAVTAADQVSFNLLHRFGERGTLSGTYMYYDSEEGNPTWYGGGPADPGSAPVFRQVHVLALNQTFLPLPDAVLTFRYGYTSFVDDYRVPEFDAMALGYSPRFLDQISAPVFPEICVDGYGAAGWCTLGNWSSQDSRYYSHSANGTLSRFVGRHTLKLGADYRRIGLDDIAGGPAAGTFDFDAGFTQGPDPTNPDPGSGNALANLLLGYPSSGSIFVTTPIQQFLDYFGGFVQDDWRVTPDLVLNLGLRVEHETGLREKNDRQTVGFDRETPWPVQPVEGMTLQGGLMYAGVSGYPEHQGDPTPVKWGPRAGVAWSIDSRTVLRGGYGMFWAPFKGSAASRRGFEASTGYRASSDGGLTPAATLSDPFPSGVEQPVESSLGLLTGAGGDVDFADQFQESAYVQQYSVELEREIGRDVLFSAGYLGSRSDRLPIGQVNINQLDPQLSALGPALLEPVPNPFFGNPVFGNLSQSEEVPRNQLLRPYPQFGALHALGPSEGRRRYHAVVLRAERKFRGGLGGRINYVWSRNDDNIFNEGVAFSWYNLAPLDSYSLGEEYGRSMSDAPHRLNASGIVELPFGRGKRWLDEDGLWNALFGGWSISAAGFYQSGFPIIVFQGFDNTGLLGDLQRPNIVPGVDPGHSGSTEQNLDRYLNPDAWSFAPAFSFGDAPRTDTRVRTPSRHNWDFAFQKSQRAGLGDVTIRLEVINAFNHADFGGPVTDFGTPSFGKIVHVFGFPRLLQFMV